jgi:caffeoyl-CoA O-methyltransferase
MMEGIEQLIQSYIEALNRPLDIPDWDKLYNEAVKLQVPAVRKDTAKLLYLLVKLKNPANVLEIGTGSGFSALWMGRGLSADALLTTLERDKNRYEKAGALFRDRKNIRVLNRDAFRFLKETGETFDFVFLDAQKRDYIDFLPLLERKINSGGVLVTDNFLFQGKAAAMSTDEEDKYKGGVELLKKYNEALANHPAFETLFLGLDDGVAVAVKN